MKTNASHKISVGALLLAMLLANVGCGQTSATPDDTTVPADTAADNTEVITSNLPDKDYGGAKFTILQRFFGEGSTKNFF